MIVMIIKGKKWKNNTQRLANTKEIEEKKGYEELIFASLQECYLVAQLLLELRGTILNRVKALITSLWFLSPQFLCARYSFRDCFNVIFQPRGNEIGSKEIDKVQFFAPDGSYILESAILMVTNIFASITFSSRLFSIR